MTARAGTDDEAGQADAARPRRPRARAATAPKPVASTIRQLPSYLRLIAGLLTDGRVSLLDKALVAAAVAYVVSPIDLIPESIPILGELDDLFVIALALQHLVGHADPAVVMAHWSGDPEELEQLDVRRAITVAAFFLPLRLRRKLRLVGR
jgi:uncharacterized membrane protein YkvA (DUF1232 family)